MTDFKKQKENRITLAIRLPQSVIDMLPNVKRGKFIERLIIKNNEVTK